MCYDKAQQRSNRYVICSWGDSIHYFPTALTKTPLWRRRPLKTFLPFMNSRLRRAIHKKNMSYNASEKGKVTWDTYRRQRKLTTAINKQSKSAHFEKDVAVVPKINLFGKTVIPVISYKTSFKTYRTILQEGTLFFCWWYLWDFQ